MGEMNWFECEFKCENAGLMMLCIENEDQNDFIADMSDGKEVGTGKCLSISPRARHCVR